jgi:hypothetical protein
MNARYLVALALLAFAPAGFTLQTNTMELTGVGTGTVADGVYVSPYVGNINNGNTYAGYMICDDFNTESYLNTPWAASMTNAGALGSGPVKFTGGVLFESTQYSAQQAYNAAAWLANGLLSPGILGNPVNQTNYAFAIWDIFDGKSTDPKGGAVGMEEAAFKAVQGGYVGSNVSVYTPVKFSDSQEFLVVNKISAPEIDPTSAASGLTLLLGALAVVRGRTKRVTVA